MSSAAIITGMKKLAMLYTAFPPIEIVADLSGDREARP